MRYFVFYVYYDESTDEMINDSADFPTEEEALGFLNGLSGGSVDSARLVHGTEVKLKRSAPQWAKDED